MSDEAQKPFVNVLAAEPQLREQLIDSLRGSGLVRLEGSSQPDMVCVGCAECLPAREIEQALRYGTGEQRVPVVLMTCRGSEELAVEAFRRGVSEYIKVPFSRQQLRAILLALKTPCGGSRAGEATGCLVGHSAAIREITAYIERVAITGCNVLVTGATGTGKEIVARLIHSNSHRAHKSLICINCAALPEGLLESELFGYERGAFTGAHVRQEGMLKVADHGTIFLDEIGEMSPNAQAKLLRVLENREIQKLGSTRPELVDIRVIAATNGELQSLMNEGKFRRDLFFRLNVARIHLPSLRERKEDILGLASYFRKGYNQAFGRHTTGFTKQAEQLLLMHDWPGNIRELRNVIEAAFIELQEDTTLLNLPKPFCNALQTNSAAGSTEVERILAALAESHWNKSRAAERLHWSRMTLYRKILQYQLANPSHNRKDAA